MGEDSQWVRNDFSGQAQNVVQVGTVNGSVHFHGASGGGSPCRYGLIPAVAPGFQSREALPDTPGCTVVAGTGGVGKTQLVAEYARHRWSTGEIGILGWLSATNRSAAASGLTGLGRAWCGGDPDPEWVLDRLATTDIPWLVVLDDLQDPRDLDGLWPPDSRFGRVVVTTRRRDSAIRSRDRRVVEVGVFTPEQSRSCLVDRLSAEQLVGVDEIGELVGHLPLAVGQAAAYMADRGLTCEQYSRRWRERSLASLFPPAGELTREERAVALTWALSVELADELEPVGLAGRVLAIVSVLDSHGIPMNVVTSPPVTQYLGSTAEDVADAVGCLARVSLITWEADLIRIHALTQRATREATTDIPSIARVAADALYSVWPEADIDGEATLRANTTALAAVAGTELYTSDLHAILLLSGVSLGESGQHGAAIDYFRRLLADATDQLGPDHPDALNCRNSISHWQAQAGNIADSWAGLRELLPDLARTLGPGHPFSLMTRNNAAYLRGENGDAAGAVAELQALLPHFIRVLGPDHRNTLNNRQCIAFWLHCAGHIAQAFAAYRQLLADRTRVLGPEHLHTLVTRNNIAGLLGDAGNPVKAVRELEALLVDMARVLGTDHPETLNSRVQLTRWRSAAKGTEAPLTELEPLLSDVARVLGPEHLLTFTVRRDTARCLYRDGNPARAIAELETLLADQLRVLSTDHPDTLNTRHSLAGYLRDTGDHARALTVLLALLPDITRTLGPDDKYTLDVRYQIALCHIDNGNQDSGREKLEALLPAVAQVMGLTHTYTHTIRELLASPQG
ncbi:FxSxx-COOH system tetratricopeptide repeat protein [Umezawaea sp. Da 62-37]|uniref:FxSxx-COOH system tetratricopeptide repeat protein n=1 Tax=Umezawaea sp. Da 62-37 TaxID=3075927 RepID=UPI0028F6E28F|nr:FxSxx-COOH system tetratricopeptide repeat protein [Umezawaea sp. Da 62-37]WNV84978.1 FxSxx-COOH system tetratricopeptide repeat protein [Umezawaea sp. Da 62-37]